MHAVDVLIVLTYLLLVLLVGLASGRQERDTRDYIAGGRNVPWWAVLGSLVATEVSAMTFLNVPGEGFGNNMTYLQTTLGSVLARFFVASVFITAFYRFDCLTIYEYLAKRFGNMSRRCAALFFALTRLIGSGIRLLVAVLALTVILDIPFLPTLIGFAAFACLYAGRGGIRSVIYTDCVQGLIFLGGGIFVFIFLIQQTGWEAYLETASAAGRLEIFRLTPEANSSFSAWFNDSSLLYVAMLFGFLNTTAAMGTDQDMTQRLLTCRDASQSKKSLILSGFAALGIASLFMLVGTALYAYYQLQTGVLQDGTLPDNNRIFAHFIANSTPVGLKGLLLAGVLAASMSSLDSAMAALSASSVVDLIKPLLGSDVREEFLLKLSRFLMGVFALVLVLIAYLLRNADESLLWLSFKLVGIPYSVLLGMFLLGLLSTRGDDSNTLIAALSGCAIGSGILALVQFGHLPLAWPWCLFGTTLWVIALGAWAPFSKCSSRA